MKSGLILIQKLVFVHNQGDISGQVKLFCCKTETFLSFSFFVDRTKIRFGFRKSPDRSRISHILSYRNPVNYETDYHQEKYDNHLKV